MLTALAGQLGRLADLGLLRVPEPIRAAGDFAFLLVGRSLDEGMFRSPEPVPTASEVGDVADHAVDVFLAAYRARESPT